MSVSYNSTRTMRAFAIGTIMPWTGNITAVPKGWLICNGQTLSTNAYPLLYANIGNTYGGTPPPVGSTIGTFQLPRLGNKALVDYKRSHAEMVGVSSQFTSTIGVDSNAVANLNYISKIDVVLDVLSNTNILSGTVRGISVNDTSYSDIINILERRLGDLHTQSHGHSGSYVSIRTSPELIEGCQSGAPYYDPCGTPDLYKAEHTTPSSSRCDIAVTNQLGGTFLAGEGAGVAGQIPIGSNNAPPRTNQPRNYSSGDMAVSTGNRNYPVALNHNYTEFVSNTLTGHLHDGIAYNIRRSSFNTRSSVPLGTIGTGNVRPINAANREILNINMNVATPSLQLIYIIKAY